MPTLRQRIANLLEPGLKNNQEMLSPVTARVDDSSGWTSLTGRTHDYDQSQIYELYQDALEAWRKNPIAWRIIAITTDYVVGDRIQISSTHRGLNKYIKSFWSHPKNLVDLRLESMSDELSRAGDLFILLFRNPQDGLSYIRFVTKDRIIKIDTAENDWETELAYHEQMDQAAGTRIWSSHEHPDAAYQDAVMLHYSVNRPLGAMLGESDLTTMIPWLLRYSRMLEDRVRLHWATRMFMWMVTVPANKVKEKIEQYRVPPDTGAIVVKDESEKWESVHPVLRATDASADLSAVRHMIDAGSGYPPHWRGEGGDANLATATAMQGPTEKHLMRRQQYFIYILEDILYHAYQRAAEIGLARLLTTRDYSMLFSAEMPDISTVDNAALANSSKAISESLAALGNNIAAMPPELARQAVRMTFYFAGQPLTDTQIDAILKGVEWGAKEEEPVTAPKEESK